MVTLMDEDQRHKVHENQPAADGEDVWRNWNVWADERADNRIQEAFDGWLCSLIAEAVTTEGNELLDIVREGFRKRDERIAALEGKVSVLLGLLQAKCSARHRRVAGT
jgi:hypothetical protein